MRAPVLAVGGAALGDGGALAAQLVGLEEGLLPHEQDGVQRERQLQRVVPSRAPPSPNQPTKPMLCITEGKLFFPSI